MRSWVERYSKYIFLLILVFATGTIAYLRVSRQLVMGPSWDTYDYLANALEFAGKGTGYFAVYNRAPLLSFLVSIPLRFSFGAEPLIFYIDAFLYFSGVTALFLLMRRRFNSLQSFLGALLYASSSVVLLWMAQGLTDVASLSISIWAFYFLVLAVERPRFYLLAFPFIVLTFLARFPGALIVFPAAIYLMLRGNLLKHTKDISLGVLLSALVALPYLVFSMVKFGSPFYQIGTTLGIAAGQKDSSFYQPNPFYYLKYLHSYLATGKVLGIPISSFLIGIALVGLIIYLVRHIWHARKTPMYILVLGLAAVALFTAKNVSALSGMAILSVALFAFFWIIKERQEAQVGIDALFISWLSIFLIFHSLFPIKVERFFIPMVPGMAYLTILAWDEMASLIPTRYAPARVALHSVMTLSLGILVGLSLLNSFPRYLTRDVQPDLVNVRVKNTSQWLKSNQKGFERAKIYSEVWPHFSWHLRHGTEPPPSTDTAKGFLHELLKNNVDYYLGSLQSVEGASDYYTKIYDESYAIPVYRRNQKAAPLRPRALLIGKGWQSYIEHILDYNVYIYSGRSSYIDNYNSAELSKYKSLFLYNFDWHDLDKAESLLKTFAEKGGVLVIDFSGNKNLTISGTQFLTTVVAIKNLPVHPAVKVHSSVAVSKINFSTFVGEDGGSWSGASYKNPAITSLVTADEDMLIGKQAIGKGKIYWIGYNLVWHSFLKKNKDEQALIRSILQDGLRK